MPDSTLDLVLSTETPVPVLDVGRGEVIDEVLVVRGIELPKGGTVPLLDTHGRDSVQNTLGSIRALRAGESYAGPSLLGRAHFGDDDGSQRVHGLYRDGHLTDFSIGAKRMEVTMRGGVRYVTRSLLIEGSTVVRGADEYAKVLPVRRADEEIFQFNPYRMWQQEIIQGDDMLEIKLRDREFTIDADGAVCRGEILLHDEGDALVDALVAAGQRDGDGYVLRSADLTPELQSIVRALSNPETVRVTKEDLGIHYARGYVAE